MARFVFYAVVWVGCLFVFVGLANALAARTNALYAQMFAAAQIPPPPPSTTLPPPPAVVVVPAAQQAPAPMTTEQFRAQLGY